MAVEKKVEVAAFEVKEQVDRCFYGRKLFTFVSVELGKALKNSSAIS